MTKELKEITREDGYNGCGSNSCIMGSPGGIGTNGGCGCLKELSTKNMLRVKRFIYKLIEISEDSIKSKS